MDILRKVITVVPVLIGISLLTFGLLELVPGDPAEIVLRQKGLEPTQAAIEAQREQLGLNAPVATRYWRWLRGMARLDMGRSYYSGEPVAELLAAHFIPTFKLSAASFFFMIVVAWFSGLLSAAYRNRWIDRLNRAGAILATAMPVYGVGLLLIYVFAVKLHLFPVSGDEGMKSLVLPAVTLGLSMAAVNSRLIRERLLDAWTRDYIVLARCKGLGAFPILIRHVLKNILAPLLVIWGVSLGHLLGGTVIIETVFSWPGMGALVLQAVSLRDYPLIQGYTLVMALVFVSVNIFVDIVCLLMDPKTNAMAGEGGA